MFHFLRCSTFCTGRRSNLVMGSVTVGLMASKLMLLDMYSYIAFCLHTHAYMCVCVYFPFLVNIFLAYNFLSECKKSYWD